MSIEPKVGDVIMSGELGLKNSHIRMTWTECPSCGKGLWRRLSDKKCNPKKFNCICFRCSNKESAKKVTGDKHPLWNGGRLHRTDGYIGMLMDKNDPFYEALADSKGYVLEHRYIMSVYLGRPLVKGEIVHHVNGIKTDNRLENLYLTTIGEHCQHHHRDYVKAIQERVTSLEERITMLEAELTALKYTGVV